MDTRNLPMTREKKPDSSRGSAPLFVTAVYEHQRTLVSQVSPLEEPPWFGQP